jgi:hypothetical protein
MRHWRQVAVVPAGVSPGKRAEPDGGLMPWELRHEMVPLPF